MLKRYTSHIVPRVSRAFQGYAPQSRMGLTKIVVRGARQHNLKNINVEIPRNTLTVITGLSAPANPRSRLTRFTPKASGVMWNRFPPTRGNFWTRWSGRKWTRSRGFRLRSRSNKRPRRARRDRRSERSPKFTITCAWSTVRLARRIARIAAKPITRQSTEQIVQAVTGAEARATA